MPISGVIDMGVNSNHSDSTVTKGLYDTSVKRPFDTHIILFTYHKKEELSGTFKDRRI